MTLPAANPLLTSLSLVEQLQARLRSRAMAPEQVPPLTEWIIRRKLILEGFPLSVESRPWLRRIYDDRHTHIVLRKATQVGGSVWAIIAAIQKCDVIPDWRSTIYFFPTKTDVLEFSQTRVKPLIEENPQLQDMVGGVDRAGVRQMGAGHMYFRGMRSKVGLKSAPADMVVFDELDEADKRSREMAVERLASSKYKYILELSNPSEPGLGIDLAFAGNTETGQQGSDERYWMIRCGACRTHTAMEVEFPREVGQEDLRCLRPAKKYLTTWRRAFLAGTPAAEMGWYRACVKCGKELDPVRGEWVAAKPRVVATHGYSLSQLYSPTVAPAEIVEAYATTRQPHHFYNLKIGIGWVPSTDRLTVSQVKRWCTDAGLLQRSDLPCTMGVDQGAVLHVVVSRPGPISGSRQVVHIGEHTDWSELDDLMRRFHVIRCVVDGLPEQRNARSFALRHKGKVFLNFYNDNQKGRPAWNEDNLKVEENRTESLDASRAPFHVDPQHADAVLNTSIVLLPRDMDAVDDFARHMAAPVKKRIEEVDASGAPTGSVVYRYSEGGAPDHYAHAWNYDCLCWMEDTSSATRPGSGLALGSLGTGLVTVQGGVTNPEHPMWQPRRRLRVRNPRY